jgi:hypothetical protein
VLVTEIRPVGARAEAEKKALFGTIDPVKIVGSGGGAVRFGCGRSAALADAVAIVRIVVSARHGFFI